MKAKLTIAASLLQLCLSAQQVPVSWEFPEQGTCTNIVPPCNLLAGCASAHDSIPAMFHGSPVEYIGPGCWDHGFVTYGYDIANVPLYLIFEATGQNPIQLDSVIVRYRSYGPQSIHVTLPPTVSADVSVPDTTLQTLVFAGLGCLPFGSSGLYPTATLTLWPSTEAGELIIYEVRFVASQCVSTGIQESQMTNESGYRYRNARYNILGQKLSQSIR